MLTLMYQEIIQTVSLRHFYDSFPLLTGRTKLEPVSIIIISVVMSLASVQMIRESIEKIIEYAVEHTSGPIMQIITVVICALTVGMDNNINGNASKPHISCVCTYTINRMTEVK